MRTSLKIAIVQEGPVYLDLKRSLEKIESLATEASSQGAELIVFGETWLCGYPAWLDYCLSAALWNYEPTKQVFARMLENGVTVPGKATELLAGLAKSHQTVIAVGINETVANGPGSGTIFNSFLLFGSTGELLIHHRKLMPTYTEKMVYGFGDPRGLTVAQTTLGRIGGLICWEHFMPLSRQAMHNEGELIHLALWPKVHEMHQVASRFYAFEGRCFVVAAGQMMRAKDIPSELELPVDLKTTPDKLLLNGGSCIIAPNGFYDLEPQFDKEGIIFHDLHDLDRAAKERMTLDTSGHYQRPDVFRFEVVRNPLQAFKA